MTEAHKAARRRNGSKLQVLLEPPAGLEEAIANFARQWEPLGERNWISALWLTDVRSLLSSGQQTGVLGPMEAQRLTEAILQSSASAAAAGRGMALVRGAGGVSAVCFERLGWTEPSGPGAAAAAGSGLRIHF